ncbi:hypothetical protein F5J12DRAFT_892405 [Pisolithus orientalis]|uniref:uncharacterized protein n=1 Tax=Pisolithus orientalis TaxID=936130 RepID=UPI002224143B|nr:uncharacterized protein F5J12DRAFT_892405 [Pisolithus orientalis]KAI6007525.1 hypothetical protein F5J12DRAFT_892405 [Pisolithus orientalis]
MEDSLHTMVVLMLKAAFGTAPVISSSSIFSNHQLRKPRATLQGESGLTSDAITSLEVRLASTVITHAILNPYVLDWDADRFSEPLVHAKDRTIHFENPKIGCINAPATVLDVHGRVIVWYLPGIIPDARIELLNSLLLSIKDNLQTEPKNKPKDNSKLNKQYGHKYQPVDQVMYGHCRISMSPATFQQAHERLVDTLYQSTSLKQKANREWPLKISYVEHFWSNVAKVSLPGMARAGG